MRPVSIPTTSLRTLASGASEFVVHEPLENTSAASTSSRSSFTPRTKVGTSPLAGAETMTFFAPPLRCRAALSRAVKRPVDSITTSTPASPQGIRAGSDSERTVMVRSATRSSSP